MLNFSIPMMVFVPSRNSSWLFKISVLYQEYLSLRILNFLKYFKDFIYFKLSFCSTFPIVLSSFWESNSAMGYACYFILGYSLISDCKYIFNWSIHNIKPDSSKKYFGGFR